MDFTTLKPQIENNFYTKLEVLKALYQESPKAVIYLTKGKDDLRGRCLMINFQAGHEVWLSMKGVKVTLWQDDEEYGMKDQVIELLTELAKSNQLENVSVQETN